MGAAAVCLCSASPSLHDEVTWDPAAHGAGHFESTCQTVRCLLQIEKLNLLSYTVTVSWGSGIQLARSEVGLLHINGGYFGEGIF